MLGINTLKRGTLNGLQVTWELTKVVLPIYIAITILKHTPVLPWIAGACAPAMKLVGLPGEASLALILGYTINLYAAIGAIMSLSLDSRQITIIASMLLLAHSLFIETAVARRTGIRVGLLLAIRIGISFLSGVALNLAL
ncbi:MAG: nucleoside recognition domain-containing protein [Bacillota bacterium]